jgi:adenine-specific DNA methylase
VTLVRSFIETQLPISKLSQESYKERKAGNGQTLTGVGKWWGRKPLILVRATILSLLMPASDNPKRDREIFLKLLTMDEEGLIRRRSKKFTLVELIQRMTAREKAEYNAWLTRVEAETEKKQKQALREAQSDWLEAMQAQIFLRLPYDQKLAYCDRPSRSIVFLAGGGSSIPTVSLSTQRMSPLAFGLKGQTACCYQSSAALFLRVSEGRANGEWRRSHRIRGIAIRPYSPGRGSRKPSIRS